MWVGRMRGHAEPLVTTLVTQKGPQLAEKHFGVLCGELENCSKKKEEEEGREGAGTGEMGNEGRKERKEEGGGGEMKAGRQGWCGWCSVVQCRERT